MVSMAWKKLNGRLRSRRPSTLHQQVYRITACALLVLTVVSRITAGRSVLSASLGLPGTVAMTRFAIPGVSWAH